MANGPDVNDEDIERELENVEEIIETHEQEQDQKDDAEIVENNEEASQNLEESEG